MSERIFTLFGEEIVPEQLKAVGKSRAKKKTEDKKEDEEEPEKDTEPAVAAVEEAPIADVVATEVNVETIVAAEESMQPAEEPAAAASSPVKAKAEKKKKELAAPHLPEDWNGEVKYYSIGEVADLFKVKTSHIRFWTNEFKINVRTTRKGDRLYTNEQIREIRTIHHLVKERGFTLTGAKAKLKAQNNLDVETVDLKQSLLQLRNKLMAIKNQLK